MIKNKEERKARVMKRFEEVYDDLMSKMEAGSKEDFFPIDEIEEITLIAQKEAWKIILEESNQAVNSIEEQDIIDKKNGIYK
jgi:hypothetical protein